MLVSLSATSSVVAERLEVDFTVLISNLNIEISPITEYLEGLRPYNIY